MEQTIERNTIDYTDRNTRKRAVITYKSVFFKFRSILAFDRLYLYLLPDKLTSYMRLTDSAGIFTEKLNSEMTYRLVVIAWQKEQAFYYSQTNIQPTTYNTIPLIPMSAADVDQRLRALASPTQSFAIQQEQEYFHFEYHDRTRRTRDQALRDLTNRMIDAFFPCMSGDRYPIVNPASLPKKPLNPVNQ
jgi:hypothetical protein